MREQTGRRLGVYPRRDNRTLVFPCGGRVLFLSTLSSYESVVGLNLTSWSSNDIIPLKLEKHLFWRCRPPTHGEIPFSEFWKIYFPSVDSEKGETTVQEKPATANNTNKDNTMSTTPTPKYDLDKIERAAKSLNFFTSRAGSEFLSVKRRLNDSFVNFDSGKVVIMPFAPEEIRVALAAYDAIMEKVDEILPHGWSVCDHVSVIEYARHTTPAVSVFLDKKDVKKSLEEIEVLLKDLKEKKS
jgi:predicted nucleic acid-binding Zn finger protein